MGYLASKKRMELAILTMPARPLRSTLSEAWRRYLIRNDEELVMGWIDKKKNIEMNS